VWDVGGGGVEQGEGNEDCGATGSNEFGLARLGAAGPERAQWSRTQAEATRIIRHGTNDIGKATNGSNGEAKQTKKAKLETTSADNTTAQRKENNSSGNGNAGGTAVMTAAMAVRAVQGGTRRLAETGRRGF
jgi:hypothetical protein